jgi:rhodanese-related sulfurtransferase
MLLTSFFGIVLILLVCVVLGARKSRQARDILRYGISPEALHVLLGERKDVLLYDVRVPLDLLAHPEIIRGATWWSPHEIPNYAAKVSKGREIVIYGTASMYKTYRKIIRNALSFGFTRIRILDGGFEAWKAKGYDVAPYETPFRLDSSPLALPARIFVGGDVPGQLL